MMHPATVVVLACVCTVYAQQVQSIPLSDGQSRVFSLNHQRGPVKYPSRILGLIPNYVETAESQYQAPSYPTYQASKQLSMADKALLDSSPVFSWSNLLPPWVIQKDQGQHSRQETNYPFEWEDIERYGSRNHPEPNEEDATSKAWIAPSYHQSLEDFDKVVREITSHFTPDAPTNKEDRNYRYVILIHVVDNLSRHVAQHGWSFFNKNYTGLTRRYMENAVENPQEAIKRVKCSVLDEAKLKTQNIRKLINNPAIKNACYDRPSSCDTVIHAALKSKSDRELEREADFLLSVGKAASTFLRLASAFDAISTQNVFTYVMKEGDKLRELINSNAEAYRKLYPEGESNKCSVPSPSFNL